MSNKEKIAGRRLADALRHLPEDKAEYFIGYADGVEDAVKAAAEKEDDDAANRNDDAGEGR